MLNVVDKRTPGDLWHGRGETLSWRERNAPNRITRDCPGMVHGWNQMIGWLKERQRLEEELKTTVLEWFQVYECIHQAKEIYHDETDKRQKEEAAPMPASRYEFHG